MDQANNVGNRRSRRSNVLLAASIEADGNVAHVKLRNLSSQGALIDGDGLPPQGSEVLFHRNDLHVPGHIAWIRGHQAGVAFAEPLEPQDVLRNIPPRRTKLAVDHRRPGLAPKPLTLEEQRMIAQLGLGLAKNPFD